MARKSFVRFSFLLFTCFAAALVFVHLSRAQIATAATPPQGEAQPLAPGSLQVAGGSRSAVGALCPLKHTDVKAEVSGFISRVHVTQEFENPFKEKIEAVYTFPLPQGAAVDDMLMTIGERTVRGRILPREEAQAVYEDAKTRGQVASLLDQERPNIFTQAVANIMPGERVTISISYVETLKYEDGAYQFVFPMVVAPRYVPGAAARADAPGLSPQNAARRRQRVPDAARIAPPVTPEGTRAGHDISLEVALDAGVPIDNLKSNSHEIEVERPNGWRALVHLKNRAEIPNKDFVLNYKVAGGRIEDAVLAHRQDRGGFFTLILQPPDRATVEDITPKEIIFVLDTSGSMQGFPIEKAKEAMRLALDGLNPQDTFNLITFAGDTHVLFPQPVAATSENLSKAQSFLSTRSGDGGTEMMKAIKVALAPSGDAGHVRVVCFMTDGEVGNDFEIISEVQKHPDARVFAFGIGSSVNRFLLDEIAEEGRGEVEYVGLNDDGSAAARRFHERVRSPLLTDISIDWAGLAVADVYPRRIPDLFSAKPVVLSGRYTKGGRASVRLSGKMSGREFVREIPVELPEAEARHDVLQTLWARTRIDDLMRQDYMSVQQGKARADLKETITQLGLEYRLMTQFTSFVAVEEMIVTDGGAPRRIEVPVEMPEGMSRAGTLGEDDKPFERLMLMAQLSSAPSNRSPQNGPAAVGKGKGKGRGVGYGRLRNMGGGDAAVGGGGGGGGGGGSAIGTGQASGASGMATSTVSVAGGGPAQSSNNVQQGKIPAPASIKSMGVLNGRAAVLPNPMPTPASEDTARAYGVVSVQVTIDEGGRVVAAQAIGGNPLLRAAAVDAARKARYSPAMLSGRPVKVGGVIIYNFGSSKKTPESSSLVVGEREVARLVEEEKRRDLQMKLHASLFALIERLKDSSVKPGADEAAFVRDGRAEIQVWLTDKSEAVIARLKERGFEIMLDPVASKMVIGRVAIEKLAELARLDSILYITPLKSR